MSNVGIIVTSFVIALAIVGIGLAFFIAHSNEQTKKIAGQISKMIDAEHLFVSSWDHTVIALSFKSEKIVLGRKEMLVEHSFKDIVQVDVIRDNNVITSTDRGSQLSGAAVGGVLFGGVGALAAALSAKTHSTQTLKKLALRIIVDRATYYVNFIDVGQQHQGIDSATVVRFATEQADQYYGMLLSAMRHSEKLDSTNMELHLPISKSNGFSSGKADEIMKLWKLKEQGIISENDYLGEKQKILSQPG